MTKQKLDIDKKDFASIKMVAQDHPDWEIFENKAKTAVAFTNYAYNATEEGEELQKVVEDLPKGHELFFITDFMDDTKENSYRSAVFVDHSKKEVVFACAGTRMGLNRTALDDLVADAQLVAKVEPSKLTQAKEVNRIILDSLGTEAKDYKFHYTGHSLGSAMAELAAADMDIEMRKRQVKSHDDPQQISAITFENPGTKPIIDKMYKNAGLEPLKNGKDVTFKCFNNRRNMINTLNPQTGEQFTVIPSDQKKKDPNLVQLFFEHLENLCSKINVHLGQFMGLFASGGVNRDLGTDHKLSNFKKVFADTKEGLVLDSNNNVVLLDKAIDLGSNQSKSFKEKIQQERSSQESIKQR